MPGAVTGKPDKERLAPIMKLGRDVTAMVQHEIRKRVQWRIPALEYRGRHYSAAAHGRRRFIVFR
jgi:hypothetical protein